MIHAPVEITIFRKFMILVLSIGNVFLTFGCVKSNTFKVKDPFESSGKKVHLETKIIPAGTALNVLVDEVCLRKDKSRSVLTRQIYLGNKFSVKKRSKIQTHRYLTETAQTVSSIENMAKKDPCLFGVANSRIVNTESVEDDPLVIKQRHLKSSELILINEFLDSSIFGLKKDVVLAVIDTGIDLSHPDLKPNLWINGKEQEGLPGVDDDSNGYIDDIYGYNFPDKLGDPTHQIVNDHGTHVAGLAAAVGNNHLGGSGIVGGKIRIMPLNVFGKNWGSDTLDIDRAIRYAADNGANVINLSVGGPGASDTTASAITYALNKGVLVVVSAGNLTQDISNNFYFAASYAPLYKGLISVSATEVDQSKLCSFSNYSKDAVKIAATGCDEQAPKQGLLSTKSGGEYGYRKGTSMSAPLVAGALALTYGFLGEHKSTKLNVSEIEDIFLSGCQNSIELIGSVKNGCQLNLSVLLEKLKKLN